MIAAAQKLILITLGTVFVTFLALVFMRWAGSQQHYVEPSHPWYEIPTWSFLRPPQNTVCEPQKAISLDDPQAIVWVTVLYKNEAWQLKCESPISVSEKLRTSQLQNWLIEVETPADSGPLDKLIKELVAFEKDKNFGIYGPSQRVARYMRKQSPQWLYAADASSLLRLHMSASFFIETVLEFWPDFVLQFPEDKNTRLSARELRELERRKKRVILLPNDQE